MTDEQIRHNIRTALVRLRSEKGLTQQDIATITSKSLNAVGSWEQGLSLPNLPTLYKLSILYGKSLEYFFELKDE